jgi:hypothetical protein
LAALAGFQNVSRQANKIFKIESGEEYAPEHALRSALALGIEESHFLQMEQCDWDQYVEEWNEWADQPVRPYCVIRWIATVYGERELPESIVTLEDAEAEVAKIAKSLRKCACLVFNRRATSWFNPDGTLDRRTYSSPGAKANHPFGGVGRRPRRPIVAARIANDSPLQFEQAPSSDRLRGLDPENPSPLRILEEQNEDVE